MPNDICSCYWSWHLPHCLIHPHKILLLPPTMSANASVSPPAPCSCCPGSTQLHVKYPSSHCPCQLTCAPAAAPIILCTHASTATNSLLDACYCCLFGYSCSKDSHPPPLPTTTYDNYPNATAAIAFMSVTMCHCQ